MDTKVLKLVGIGFVTGIIMDCLVRWWNPYSTSIGIHIRHRRL